MFVWVTLAVCYLLHDRNTISYTGPSSPATWYLIPWYSDPDNLTILSRQSNNRVREGSWWLGGRSEHLWTAAGEWWDIEAGGGRQIKSASPESYQSPVVSLDWDLARQVCDEMMIVPLENIAIRHNWQEVDIKKMLDSLSVNNSCKKIKFSYQQQFLETAGGSHCLTVLDWV